MSPPDLVQQLTAALADRYRVERELGAGGMATVYLAHDLRHGRAVAIKVLRPDLAAVIGADRFLREIRTIAALQHPHILGLIDSGEVQGTAYFVMPYVDGESLRDRLEREKQLPVPDAVRIAGEIASALDYAHRRGVVHRDIKPENILLHDGRAVVADFGIALAVTSAGTGTRMTETGMSLGTPHYMSPEQAMGEREITGRSDVYALGAVLYEMLIGEPPFTGPTAQAIVARVVTEEPRPLGPRRRSIPPHVEAAVMTALEKVAADRFATAAEFAAALGDPSYRRTGGEAGAANDAAGAATRRRTMPLVLSAGLLAGLLLGAASLALLRPPPAPDPVRRYGVALPDDRIAATAIPSPDASRLLILPLPGEDAEELWIKERSEYDPRPLSGSRGAFNVTWSPDGNSIAWADSLGVRKLSIGGSAPVKIADSASDMPTVAWLDDGSIVYVGDDTRELRRVHSSGGAVTTLRRDSAQLLWPTAIPGTRALLFTRCPDGCFVGQQQLWALDLETGRARQIVEANRGWYVADDILVFVRRDGSVFAAPFDRDRLDTTGAAVTLPERVLTVNGMYPVMNVSPSGTLATRRGGVLDVGGEYEMVWVDRRGVATPVDSGWSFRLTGAGSNYGWALSPDGRRLAVGVETEEGDDIWVKQLPDGPFSRVSFDSAADYRPRWMPDGRLMFASERFEDPSEAAGGGLYSRRADGTGGTSLLVRDTVGVFEGQLSPDGRWLVYRRGGFVARTGGRDIMAIRPGIDSTARPLIATRYDEQAIAISPNGRWIAYESNETGRKEIFLRPFPATDDGKWQVSSGGGVAPLWSRDGRELFYVNPAREMVAIAVESAGEPRLGSPQALFHLDDRLLMSPAEFYTPHDIAPDGRFIMARQLQPPQDAVAQAPLIVTENWIAEVRSRLQR